MILTFILALRRCCCSFGGCGCGGCGGGCGSGCFGGSLGCSFGGSFCCCGGGGAGTIHSAGAISVNWKDEEVDNCNLARFVSCKVYSGLK